MTTGDLARATGETIRTVRFYEEQGLLRPNGTSGGGHRRYDREALEQLQLIIDLRELGLSISEIRGLLELRAGCRTAEAFRKSLRAKLPDHLEHARKRIEGLRRLEKELQGAVHALAGEDGETDSGPCPCSVAAENDAPRIVRVLARAGSCGKGHGGQAAKA